MRCVIVAASNESDIEYIKDNITAKDYIISADAGLDKLNKINIKPNLIVGDFDSYSGKFLENVEILRLPVCKDDTDTFYAVKEGIKRGYKSFAIFGGIGGRFDHTFANLCVLEYLSDKGYSNLLIDRRNKAFIMGKGQTTIYGTKNENVSVFPFGATCCTVSYDGLMYNMKEETLYSNIGNGPMGVSNSFLGREATITVHSGKALVVVSRD